MQILKIIKSINFCQKKKYKFIKKLADNYFFQIKANKKLTKFKNYV